MIFIFTFLDFLTYNKISKKKKGIIIIKISNFDSFHINQKNLGVPLNERTRAPLISFNICISFFFSFHFILLFYYLYIFISCELNKNTDIFLEIFRLSETDFFIILEFGSPESFQVLGILDRGDTSIHIHTHTNRNSESIPILIQFKQIFFQPADVTHLLL